MNASNVLSNMSLRRSLAIPLLLICLVGNAGCTSSSNSLEGTAPVIVPPLVATPIGPGSGAGLTDMATAPTDPTAEGTAPVVVPSPVATPIGPGSGARLTDMAAAPTDPTAEWEFVQLSKE